MYIHYLIHFSLLFILHIHHHPHQMTSLAMHLSPALAAWCLRWQPRPDWEPTPESPLYAQWNTASLVELWLLPMVPYMMWFVWYYCVVRLIIMGVIIWLYVVFVSHVFAHSHHNHPHHSHHHHHHHNNNNNRCLCSRQRRLLKTTTQHCTRYVPALYTRCPPRHRNIRALNHPHTPQPTQTQRPSTSHTHSPTQLMTRSPTSPITKFVKLAPEPYQPLMYMCGHAFWTWISLLVTPIWWNSRVLHGVFVVLCLLVR